MSGERGKNVFSLPTKFFHALLVHFIQEEVALLHGSVDLETQAQAGVLHQLRVDVMDQGLETQAVNQAASQQANTLVSPLAWCCLVLTGAYPPFSFENRCE